MNTVEYGSKPIGECASCSCPVHFVDWPAGGTRICTGCGETGPNAVLRSEAQRNELGPDDETVVRTVAP